MYVNAKAELVTLAPGLRPERRSAPLARGLKDALIIIVAFQAAQRTLGM